MSGKISQVGTILSTPMFCR